MYLCEFFFFFSSVTKLNIFALFAKVFFSSKLLSPILKTKNYFFFIFFVYFAEIWTNFHCCTVKNAAVWVWLVVSAIYLHWIVEWREGNGVLFYFRFLSSSSWRWNLNSCPNAISMFIFSMSLIFFLSLFILGISLNPLP